MPYGKIIDEDRIFLDEQMKKHTSFKIGGPADFFIIVNDCQELIKICTFVNENKIPFMIIGNGTNLLVKDNGIRGIVAKLNFNKLEIDEENEKIVVSSDYPVSKLSRKCAKLRTFRNRIFSRYSRYNWWSCKNECWSLWK